MKTIEFKSLVEDNVIRIPEVYRGIFSTPVVVILKESNADPFSSNQNAEPYTKIQRSSASTAITR
jgi:hypothetical protein